MNDTSPIDIDNSPPQQLPAAALLPPPEWTVSPGLTDYPQALDTMRARIGQIANGQAGEQIWLLQHPPLYTAGTSAGADELRHPDRFPVFQAGRGGKYTYHGPGQRVVYVMLDLRCRGRDIRAFVWRLEEWLIATLAAFGIRGERRTDRIGVWVRRPSGRAGSCAPAECKIGAIGVRVSRWITWHGVSLNIDPDLSHYAGIVPCGIEGHGVTSLADLGVTVSMAQVDAVLRREFGTVFATPQV